jgi:hypothetical protein
MTSVPSVVSATATGAKALESTEPPYLTGEFGAPLRLDPAADDRDVHRAEGCVGRA